MSYDFGMYVVEVRHREKVPLDLHLNYTYNVGKMFYAAMAEKTDKGINVIKGLPAPEAAEYLNLALSRMEEDPPKYEAMNPPNGWGDYHGALNVLRTLLDWCSKYFYAYMEVT